MDFFTKMKIIFNSIFSIFNFLNLSDKFVEILKLNYPNCNIHFQILNFNLPNCYIILKYQNISTMVLITIVKNLCNSYML